MKRRHLLASVVAAGCAGVLWLWTGRLPEVPTVAWQVGDGSAAHAAGAYQEIAADEPVRLTLAAAMPLFVYVASNDQQDGTLAWFPSPMLNTDVQNPLPAGRTTLPGHHDGVDRAWPGRPGLAVTTWIVIASTTALPDLAARLQQLRQVSNTTFTDGTLVISNPKDGKPPQGRPREQPPHALLQEALALAPQPNPDGPMQPARTPGIWLATWQTVAAKNEKGEKVQTSPLDKLKPLQPQPPK